MNIVIVMTIVLSLACLNYTEGRRYDINTDRSRLLWRFVTGLHIGVCTYILLAMLEIK